MSHISLVKVAIKTPNMQLLREAVKQLAKELGGHLTTVIEDYYGNKVNVELGFQAQAVPRGVGITVDAGGQVKMKGDFYGYTTVTAAQLQNMLTQNYTALATIRSLRNLGYQVQTQKSKQQFFIKAVAF